jgi:hypothetical protein
METVLADMRADPDVTPQRIAWFEQDPKRCTGINKQRKREGATGDDLRCKLTSVAGGWGCTRYHWTNPKAIEKAEKRVVVAEAAAVVRERSMRRDITPAEAIQEGLERRAFDMEYLGDMVEQLQGDIVREAAVRPLYREAITDTVKIGEVAERLELGKKQISLNEQETQLHIQNILPRIIGFVEDIGQDPNDPVILAALEKRFS